MESGNDSSIDECVECCVRERDFSKKEVFRCKFCNRLLCEKHIEPRLAFIPNFNPTSYSPEVEALYYSEYKRQDGHPDFKYSQIKFKELDVEEKARNELIKQALDRMNEHYRGRHIESVKYPSQPPSISYHPETEKPKPYKPNISRSRFSFHIDWRIQSLLKSLKLWFVAFWVTVGLLYLLEGNNPTSFYNSVPDAIKYVFYIFAAGISGWIGYRIFDKLDTSPTSDRGVFGLRVKSGLLTLIGCFTIALGVVIGIGIFEQPLSFTMSIGRTTISVFFVVLGLAFLMVSGYLMFKFERRSGVIVYRR
jgi:hypothetical protein